MYLFICRLLDSSTSPFSLPHAHKLPRTHSSDIRYQEDHQRRTACLWGHEEFLSASALKHSAAASVKHVATATAPASAILTSLNPLLILGGIALGAGKATLTAPSSIKVECSNCGFTHTHYGEGACDPWAGASCLSTTNIPGELIFVRFSSC